MSNMDTHISCPYCATTEIKRQHIPLANGSYHIKANCAGFGRFIKFLAHEPPRFYFGKHRGETVTEVAAKDPSYLKWCLAENIVRNARLKKAVESKVVTA